MPGATAAQGRGSPEETAEKPAEPWKPRGVALGVFGRPGEGRG